MKHLFLAGLIALMGLNNVAAQNKITVTVDGMRHATGKILVSLHNSPDTYGSYSKCYLFKEINVEQHQTTCTFDNLADGTYTVTLFHDHDNNRKLTTNFIGIPKEGFGFSNNAKVRIGKPDYKLAKFDVKNNANVTQLIHLQFL
ncbi:MAG: DUF2141 domain-containing protein [Mucinivorans sp.]